MLKFTHATRERASADILGLSWRDKISNDRLTSGELKDQIATLAQVVAASSKIAQQFPGENASPDETDRFYEGNRWFIRQILQYISNTQESQDREVASALLAVDKRSDDSGLFPIKFVRNMLTGPSPVVIPSAHVPRYIDVTKRNREAITRRIDVVLAELRAVDNELSRVPVTPEFTVVVSIRNDGGRAVSVLPDAILRVKRATEDGVDRRCLLFLKAFALPGSTWQEVDLTKPSSAPVFVAPRQGVVMKFTSDVNRLLALVGGDPTAQEVASRSGVVTLLEDQRTALIGLSQAFEAGVVSCEVDISTGTDTIALSGPFGRRSAFPRYSTKLAETPKK